MHHLSMQCIETIKIQDQTISNIAYHNQRLNRTRQELFNCNTPIDLQEHITPPHDQQLYRCRINYDQKIQSIEYIPYTPREQRRFILAESDIVYDYKYANRDGLNALKAQHPHCDDIIITHHGVLKDTSIANIAFFDGKEWYTPKNPLLKGTMREYLLQTAILKEKTIKIDEIEEYHGFAVMNAMVGFKIINNPSIIRRKYGESIVSKSRV